MIWFGFFNEVNTRSWKFASWSTGRELLFRLYLSKNEVVRAKSSVDIFLTTRPTIRLPLNQLDWRYEKALYCKSCLKLLGFKGNHFFLDWKAFDDYPSRKTRLICYEYCCLLKCYRYIYMYIHLSIYILIFRSYLSKLL